MDDLEDDRARTEVSDSLTQRTEQRGLRNGWARKQGETGVDDHVEDNTEDQEDNNQEDEEEVYAFA